MRKSFFWLTIFFLVLSIGLIPSGKKTQTADLVLINGKIVTMDESKPVAEALAVGQGRILTIGSDKAIKSYIGESTKTIDLEG